MVYVMYFVGIVHTLKAVGFGNRCE